ncbi:MAG: hypothetical protein LBH03_02740 [Holophagales bacterium]|jgi:hypothetical protein|nr:hypothetical protein [Holophagales bacterium]
MSQQDNNPKMISKPGASPVLAMFLTLFYSLGPVYNGQTSKWPVLLLIEVIGHCLCLLPGLLIRILCIIDAYQTAIRLQSGESIPENEYSLQLLYNIVKIIDKTATCSRA